MRQEKEEKELQTMEKNVKNAEKMMTTKKEPEAPQRSWFQTPAEKRKEKSNYYFISINPSF